MLFDKCTDEHVLVLRSTYFCASLAIYPSEFSGSLLPSILLFLRCGANYPSHGRINSDSVAFVLAFHLIYKGFDSFFPLLSVFDH